MNLLDSPKAAAARIAELEALLRDAHGVNSSVLEYQQDRWASELRSLKGEPEPIRNPAPDSCQPRPVTKAKRRKKTIADYVPNQCRCYSYANTGKIGPKAKRCYAAHELCQCQVRPLFAASLLSGHPADLVRTYHLFNPTTDDREHIEWMCLMSAREWLGYPKLAIYGRLPLPKVIADLEWRATMIGGRSCQIEGKGREVAEAVLIGETNLPAFLVAYRAAWAEASSANERWHAESCPEVMAALWDARASGDPKKVDAARKIYGEWLHLQQSLQIGLTAEQHDDTWGEGAKRREAARHHTH